MLIVGICPDHHQVELAEKEAVRNAWLALWTCSLSSAPAPVAKIFGKFP
jgi:hypothetical protein